MKARYVLRVHLLFQEEMTLNQELVESSLGQSVQMVGAWHIRQNSNK